MHSGLSDRPRVDCLLWWPVGPWECLLMGPAEPDVDENKLLKQWNASQNQAGEMPQQDDLPSERESL